MLFKTTVSAVLVSLVVLLNIIVLCLFDYVEPNKYDDDDEGKTNFSRHLKQFDGLT